MKLLIRADGNARIGTGHVMRCLSLAQAWKRSGGEAVFAVSEVSCSLEDRLRAAVIPVVKINFPIGSAGDARQTIQLAREQNADWTIADGYLFGSDYQRQIKGAGFRLMLLDDYGHAEHYFADLVLNQNLGVRAGIYAQREDATRLLLGARYALLRQEFLAYKNWKREIPAIARKVLVTLGGADPDKVTDRVSVVLKQFTEIEAKVLVGGSNPHIEQLKSKIRNPKSEMELIVDATNMPELMAWADVAIAAGGTTSWELAFMGLPALTFVLADNQREVVESLDRAQVARKTKLDSLASELRSTLSDSAARNTMSERARQLVDGLGASRVISHLRAAKLQLRPVRAEDCRQIWDWANDPEARAVSFSPEWIPWESHLRWYAAKSRDPNCFFYVAMNGSGQPLGQVRFELNGNEAVISVGLAREARGRGYGPALILRGSARCFEESNAALVHAYIKGDNQTSIRAFERADFQDAGTVELRGHQARHFVFNRRGI